MIVASLDTTRCAQCGELLLFRTVHEKRGYIHVFGIPFCDTACFKTWLMGHPHYTNNSEVRA